MKTSFTGIEEFYNDNPSRRTSPEADYGSHWLNPDRHQRYRVSYIRDTGEIYAACLSSAPSQHIHLLGHVPPDPVEDNWKDIYYHTLESVLDGWPEHGNTALGTGWVKQRIKAAGYTTY